MNKTVSRAVFNALLPAGSAWAVEPGGELDKLLDGMADNAESVADFMSTLAYIRDPYLTPFLDDLEREYGITKDTRLSEETRRMRLAAKMYAGSHNGGRSTLQKALTRAGFDVQVHSNSPAVDPANFLTEAFLMVAGDANAFAGYTPSGDENPAVAGRVGGELLVNGALFEQRAKVLTVALGPTAIAGHEEAVAGRFVELETVPVDYTIPTDPGVWPFVFFVGGEATRDPETKELTSINRAEIPAERAEEFKRIILTYKPLSTWAGLILTFV